MTCSRRAEQRLLDRLSVFAGGCTLGAATAVCAGDGVEEWEVLDLLGSLVNKSLVQAEEAGGEVRYGLLETVRQYGQERLAAAGGLAARAGPAPGLVPGPGRGGGAPPVGRGGPGGLAGPAGGGARQPAGGAALGAGARGRGGGAAAGRGAGVLLARPRLPGRGARLAGGRAGRGRRRTGRGPRQGARRGGRLASWQGDFGRAVALFEESLALYRALGDTRGIAAALEDLAIALERQGDYARATRRGRRRRWRSTARWGTGRAWPAR